jgi:lipoprotein NlpI
MWCALLRRRLHLPASEQDLPVVTATSQDGWTKALAAYLAGSLSEADLQAAEQALPEPDRTKKNCEFLYYTGMQHLLENDVAGARSRFQQSVDTGIVSYSEYERAQAELKRLDEPAAGREAEDKGKQPAGDRPAI